MAVVFYTFNDFFGNDLVTVEVFLNNNLGVSQKLIVRDEWQTFAEEELRVNDDTQAEDIIKNLVQNIVVNFRDMTFSLNARRHAYDVFVKDETKQFKFIIIHDLNFSLKHVILSTGDKQMQFGSSENDQTIIEKVLLELKN